MIKNLTYLKIKPVICYIFHWTAVFHYLIILISLLCIKIYILELKKETSMKFVTNFAVALLYINFCSTKALLVLFSNFLFFIFQFFYYIFSYLGLCIDFERFMFFARRPTGVSISFVAQFIFMPAAALALVKCFQLDLYKSLTILVIGCSPGGILSNILSYYYGGDVNLRYVFLIFLLT